MATRALINPPEFFTPPGFSHVVSATGTRQVLVAGQVALSPDFSIIGGEISGSSEHPAQTIIGVAGLALPGLLIEIEVTALVD